jgi:hypothetical protein
MAKPKKNNPWRNFSLKKSSFYENHPRDLRDVISISRKESQRGMKNMWAIGKAQLPPARMIMDNERLTNG